jgi:hypothetical protein
VKRVEKSRSRGVEEKSARQQDGETASRGDARVLGTGIVGEAAREHAIDPEIVEIRPEPSPAERAAILIALEQMLGTRPRDEARQPSAWALAGRRESVLGSGVGSRIGWGRGSDRLSGW